MIEMRHHFSRAAVTGDPAEIMIAVLLAEAGVGGERGQAVGGDAAGNRVGSASPSQAANDSLPCHMQ